MLVYRQFNPILIQNHGFIPAIHQVYMLLNLTLIFFFDVKLHVTYFFNNRKLIYDHKSMKQAEFRTSGLLSDIDMKIAQMKLIDEFGVKWSKLYDAAVLGDNITVLNLLSTDRDLIQHHDRNKVTVFHAAASAGQVDTLKLLVQYCNEDITGLLLENFDKDANTPIHLAIQNGHEMAGIYLHQLNTEAAYQRNYKGVSAISMAVKKKHQNLVKCMLQSGTTLSQQEKLLQFAHKERLAHSAVKTNNRGTVIILFFCLSCGRLFYYEADLYN